MSEYVEQDTTSGYARHDLGKPPEPYTQAEVDAVALMDGDDVLVSVFDRKLNKSLPDLYVLSSPFDGTATKRGGVKVVDVVMDPKEGVYIQT